MAVLFGEGESTAEWVLEWCASLGCSIVRVNDPDELMSMALRTRPRLVLFEAGGREAAAAALNACARLKRDSYTGVVPAAILATGGTPTLGEAVAARADEVITPDMPAGDGLTRLTAMLARSERDLGAHPSTRLPGTAAIEAEIRARLETGETFAVCYADLDHFKEYNDRYSYNEGDRIIRILAMLLHDIVKGSCGERGFVGHIGGDDFIFIIPYDAVNEVCAEVTSVFDLLVPYQYSEADRRAGYFFGKDRRGVLDRVPLMTLSVGVVTNAQRPLTDPEQVSKLATEMKSYAKTLTGSVYTIDRRTDERPPVYDTRQPSILG